MHPCKLEHPSTCLIAAPTKSGKTFLVKKIIDHKMFHPMPQKIIYCYGKYQPIFKLMKNVEFIEGLPDNLNSIQNALIIIDDLMTEVANDFRLSNLFTKGCHHQNLSVIFIMQNIFVKGKEMRNVNLNSQYLILFKNPRDKSQVMILGKQMFPGKTKAFREIFQDATSPKYGYLLIDLRPNADDSLRLRTGMFPEDKCYVYQPR